MYTYKISPLKIVDGDTIDADVDLGFDIKVKKRVRFMGINAPESRTRDLEEKDKYSIYIKKNKDVLPWKDFNKNMAISIEYNLEY